MNHTNNHRRHQRRIAQYNQFKVRRASSTHIQLFDGVHKWWEALSHVDPARERVRDRTVARLSPACYSSIAEGSIESHEESTGWVLGFSDRNYLLQKALVYIRFFLAFLPGAGSLVLVKKTVV
jgi:hypothetical protein